MTPGAAGDAGWAGRARAAIGAPGWRVAGWIAISVCVVGLIALPLLRLAGAALEEGPDGLARALAGTPVRAIANSLGLAVVVTAVALVAGTALALATERLGVPGRRWLRIGLLLPLLTPPFVVAQAWAAAYGPAGLTDQFLGLPADAIYGPIGVAVVLAVTATPVVYLVVASALAARAEPELDLAARASGATAAGAVRLVTLPLLRPAMTGAGILVFLTTINAFGVPAVLGTPAGFTTITTRLYQDLAFSSDPAAFERVVALAAAMAVFAGLTVGFADVLLPSRTTTRTGGSLAPAQRPGSGARLAAAAAGFAIVLGAGVPLLALVLAALTKAVGLRPVPANWSFLNFQEALGGQALAGVGTSIGLAVIAASGVLVLGGAAAFLARRGIARVLGSVLALTFVVPGSALAVAVILAYGGLLRDTLGIILVAYIAKFWAIGHRQVGGSIDRLPPDLTSAVRASGGGAADVLRTVILPGLAPALAAAWLLVFVLGLHELTMSSLLYGPGTATLAVVVLNLQQLGDPGPSAALAVVLTLVVAAAAAPLLLLGRAGERLAGLR